MVSRVRQFIYSHIYWPAKKIDSSDNGSDAIFQCSAELERKYTMRWATSSASASRKYRWQLRIYWMLLFARHTQLHTHTHVLIDHIPVLLANRHKQWQWRATANASAALCGCAPRSSFEKCQTNTSLRTDNFQWKRIGYRRIRRTDVGGGWRWSQHKRSTRLRSTHTHTLKGTAADDLF